MKVASLPLKFVTSNNISTQDCKAIELLIFCQIIRRLNPKIKYFKSMKILVSAKRVVDYRVNVRVKPDETGVELANVKMSMNPFDEIAVEEAIKLKEQNIADEVIICSIGEPKTEDILRQGIAMGADRAIQILTDKEVQPLAASKILKKIVEKESIDLVIMGKQAIDDDMNQTGQMLSEMLGWGQGTFASEVKISDGNAEVTREVDGGLMTVKLKLPAVITTDLRLNEPRYVKLPDIMKARSKPMDKIQLDELDVDISPRFETVKVQAPAKREAGIKVEDVDQLLAELKKKQVL
jgi:electron transfer flavoprotein beta subunit